MVSIDKPSLNSMLWWRRPIFDRSVLHRYPWMMVTFVEQVALLLWGGLSGALKGSDNGWISNHTSWWRYHTIIYNYPWYDSLRVSTMFYDSDCPYDPCRWYSTESRAMRTTRKWYPRLWGFHDLTPMPWLSFTWKSWQPTFGDRWLLDSVV